MKRFWIKLVIIISTIFSIRYLYWRFDDTLNPDVLWFSLPLIIAELHGFIETSLYFFMVWNPTRRKPMPQLQGKTVDVLIPTYNEPVDILRMTLLGCKDIKYPHKTYVLDDGQRPEVKALAEEMGCTYITREERINAKGGNLNNGLKYASGEFILSLDADHVPLPTIIDETIGFFADEKVALVQMPQDFYNLDSFQHVTDRKKGYSWHEQELFYSVIQPGKDHWNAAFYCGSTTLIRRKAIDEIGGFADETITEDIHTALRLQSRGWHSVYYNKTMARGIAPSTLDGFAIQRLRWGAGAMQVWKADNPLTMKGLTIAQRLSYFASMYTYFDGIQKLIFLLTPVIILTTGKLPLLADPVTFVKYFAPYFLISIFGMTITMGSFKAMLKVEQYNLIKVVNQIKSVFRGLFGKEKYIVTPKGSENTKNIREVMVQLIIIGASFFAIIYGIYYLAFKAGQEMYLWARVASIFWATFYISLMIPLIMTALKKKESRKLYRFDGKYDVGVSYDTVEAGADELSNKGFARNISPYGCSVTTETRMPVGETLRIHIKFPDGSSVKTLGEVRRSNPIWITKREVRHMNGIEFKDIKNSDKDVIVKFLMNVAAPKQAEILKLSNETRIKD